MRALYVELLIYKLEIPVYDVGVSFSALSLLVEWQEGLLVCKNPCHLCLEVLFRTNGRMGLRGSGYPVRKQQNW